jgi:hypothetical protein
MSWLDLYAIAFDTYINLRFAIAEAVRQIGYQLEDALDAWGEDED